MKSGALIEKLRAQLPADKCDKQRHKLTYFVEKIAVESVIAAQRTWRFFNAKWLSRAQHFRHA